MHEKFKIGISIYIPSKQFGIWSNGAIQNLVFLHLLFQKSQEVEDVFLIQYNSDPSPNNSVIDFMNRHRIKLVNFTDVKDRLNVFIQGGFHYPREDLNYIKQRNAITITYKFGNDYVIHLEEIIKNESKTGASFIDIPFDEVWTHAQHLNTCKYYWEAGMHTPVYELPHIWSPMIINEAISDNVKADRNFIFNYQDKLKKPKKTISIFEPNINVVKTFVYPLIISDLAYQKHKNLFERVFLFNTFHLKNNEKFNNFATRLSIIQDNIATSETRFLTPYILGQYTDVVLSHQWENALNYAYYEALYGRYPFVHNSPFLKDVGYYYHGFDAPGGAEALLTAMTKHDKNTREYDKKCRQQLRSISIDNPEVIDAHISRLVRLREKKGQVIN